MLSRLLFVAPLSLALLGCSDPKQNPPVSLDPVYQVGDLGPAGGYIFYDDEADGVDDLPNARYLELAPAQIPLQTEGPFSDLFKWSHHYQAVDVLSPSIGAGYANTRAIAASDDDPHIAAQMALAHRVDHDGQLFDDWYLPSLHEMTRVRSELAVPGLIESTEEIGYWTSTELHEYSAYSVVLSPAWPDVPELNSSKGNNALVWPIRSF